MVGGGPLPEEAVHPVDPGRGGAGAAVEVVVQGLVAPGGEEDKVGQCRKEVVPSG